MHTVLVISSGIFHPSLPGRLALWRALRAAPGVTLRHVPFRPAGAFGAAAPVEVLAQADPPRADALVLFIHGKTISPPALDALDRFVREGGGILAVHSATASFKETPRYTEILGGRFTGHPPVGPLEIRAAGGATNRATAGVSARRDRADPHADYVTAGVDEIFGQVAPFTVTDEAYRHELADDIRVHFTARPLRPAARARAARAPDPAATHAEEELPIVWTRRHGLGRICYAGWGHCSASLRHPSAVRILQTGLAWVCRREEEGSR